MIGYSTTSEPSRQVLINSSEHMDPITKDKLQDMPKKSAEFGINMELIKCAPNSLLERLIAIISVCSQLGCIPDE
jgi:hypothetical protein